MKTHPILAAGTISILAGAVHADMVYFENNNAIEDMRFYDPNFGNTIIGHSLDITRGAYEQPELGETPVGSIFFMHLNDLGGEFIWLGTGSVTRTVESTESVLIPTPEVPYGATFFGPQDFGDRDAIGADANFIDGWRLIHGINTLTGSPGVFTVDEFFTIGVEFERDGALHYGFAEFEVGYQIMGTSVNLTILPVRWGYNDIAGEAAVVIPAPAGSLALIGLGTLVTRRRR